MTAAAFRCWTEGIGDRDRDNQLQGIDRFGEVHLKSASQRCNAILGTGIGRQGCGGEISQRFIELPHGAYELETIHLRHANVSDQHVGMYLPQRIQCGRPRVGDGHFCPDTFEQQTQQMKGVGLVIDG